MSVTGLMLRRHAALAALLISTLLLSLPAAARNPRHKRRRAAAHKVQNKQSNTHLLFELTSSFDSRPERSLGGANILFELGLRGTMLREQKASGGWTWGGELALRTLGPETEGSNTVKSDIYRLSTHAAGLLGYKWSTFHAGFMPHLSLGMSNDFALVHLVSPGNSTLRPRWLPGLFAGRGLMVHFLSFLLRGDMSFGVSDSRPEFRWNLGMGMRF